MRIIFLGTPEFALPSLEALINSRHEILAVVTQPDKPAGRGNKLTPSPVKEFAIKNKIKVLEYLKVSRDGVKDLKELNPDIMITVAYGQILSPEILDIAKHGVINVHGSLLPKYRGASPIQTAVIEGEEETGITIMQTEAGLDTGDILSQIATPIGEYETAGELGVRLASLGAQLLLDTLDKIEKNQIVPEKQNQVKATITRKIFKEDCTINFNKSAKQIKCLVYGANPEPIARAVLEKDETVIKVYSLRVLSEEEIIEIDSKGASGEVIEPTSAKNGLFVQCEPGVVELLEVQFPGKGIITGKAAVAGRKIGVGDKFKFKVATVKNNIK